MKDYTKEKMLEIWDEEDEDELEMQTAMGLDNLAEKMEIIQAEKDAQWNLGKLAKSTGAALKRAAISGAVGAKNGAIDSVWKALYSAEPGFMRRCVHAHTCTHPLHTVVQPVACDYDVFFFFFWRPLALAAFIVFMPHGMPYH